MGENTSEPKPEECFHNVWCGHSDNCAHQDGDQAHVFNAEYAKSLNNVKLNRITVDTRASWHNVNDVKKFKSFNGPNVRGMHNKQELLGHDNGRLTKVKNW